MDWFKRASGVKIFVAIWLLVLIVPLWRLRAVRQWQNNQLMAPNALNGGEVPAPLQLGLTPQNARNLAQQFPDDAAAQLTAFSQPNLGHSDVFSLSNAQLQKVAGPYFSRFAALSRRFPDSLAIRSQWLRDATQGQLSIESPDLIATYHLSPQTEISPSWMSPAQLQAALNSAREGARQEPDNAFWPWMEAIFQFSLRRDEAALSALEKAGKCSRFDDGTFETVRRRIALMRRVQPSDTEDELWEAWAVSFPHYAKMRSVARQTMWNAKLAHKRGDTARALEIAGLLQRAASPVAHGNGSLITRLVGEALAYITWGATLTNAGSKRPRYTATTPEEWEKYKRQGVVNFAAYARRNGRDDLARQALQIQSGFNTAPLIAAIRRPQFDDLSKQQNRLNRFHWLGAWLLRMAVFAGAVWIVAFVLSRRDASSQSRRAMAIWSAFCVGVTGALFWSALVSGAVNEIKPFSNDAPDFNTAIAVALPFYLSGIWLAPVILPTFLGHLRWARFNISTREFGWLHLAQLLSYAGAIGGFLVVGVTLSNPPGDTISSQLWAAPLFVFGLCALGACGFQIRNVASAMKISAALWAGAAWCWLAWLFLNAQSRGGEVDITIALIDDFYIALLGIASLVCATGAILWWLRARGFQNTLQGRFFSDLVLRTRLAAATLAVLSSVAYFGVAIVSLPVRHQAQQILERYLEVGEAAWVEEQLKR